MFEVNSQLLYSMNCMLEEKNTSGISEKVENKDFEF
jgi:hypothetical protein